MKKFAIAVDLGATNIRVAIVGVNGKIIRKIETKTPQSGKSGKAITEKIIDNIKDLQFKKGEIKGIGVASIGPLDHKKGGIKDTSNLPFSFIPLTEPLKKAFSLPISLMRDCTAAVWGEKIFGAGKKYKNMVFVTISSGIGVGAIVDGELLCGKDGNAAEMGHMIVDSFYHVQCSCKKGYNHWEEFCSGGDLADFFAVWQKKKSFWRLKEAKKAKDIFDLAKEGNVRAGEFLEEAGKINARAVSNIIVAYDPDLITFGGAVVLNNRDQILAPIKKYTDKFLRIPEIKVTPLGEDIELIGAAAAIFYPPK